MSAKEIRIETLKHEGELFRIRRTEERLQSMWQFIAERSLEGRIPSMAEIYWALALPSGTTQRYLKILEDCQEISRILIDNRPHFGWNGLDSSQSSN